MPSSNRRADNTSLSGLLVGAIPTLADRAGQAAGVSVTRALQGTVATAAHAAGVAAQPMLDGFTQAVCSANIVQLDLKKAVKDFRREWLLVVVCLLATAIVVAALMAYLAISLQRHDLQQQLATQKDKLTAEVSALQEQAEARRNNGRKAPK